LYHRRDPLAESAPAGWRSVQPIQRIKQAVGEIKSVARRERFYEDLD
jgi:hypothetical protein